jgi:biopolymer transport protein ExbD
MIALPRGEEKVVPELLPLLDILFTLLLFLLMGGQFGPREEEELRPPQGDRLDDCTKSLPRNPATVNVYHRPEVDCGRYRSGQPCPEELDHWRVSVRGRDCTGTNALCRAIRPSGRVVLRADAAAPYGLVQHALRACAAEGIRSIRVSARRAPSLR